MPSYFLSNYFRKLKPKTLFILISLVIALLITTLIYIDHFLSERDLEKDFNTESAAMFSAFQTSMINAQQNMLLIATVFSEDKQIQQLFMQAKQAVENEGGGAGGKQAAIIRKQLYELVAPRWKKAVEAISPIQLHFFLGPGALSFLRIHSPEKFGDQLDSVHFSVVDTNAQHSPRSGIETGRMNSNIRGLVPIFSPNEKKQIGTLDASSSIEQLVKNFKQASGSDVSILLRKDHIDQTMWPDIVGSRYKTSLPCGCIVEATSKPIPLDILQKAQRNKKGRIAKNGIAQLFKIDKKYYYSAFYPVRDYLGNKIPARNNIGALMIWKDVTKRISVFNQHQLLLILWATISFVFIEFLLYWGFKRGTTELQKRIKQGDSLLELSESRYQLLVENLNLLVWEYSIEKHSFTYMSPQIERLLGYPISNWLDEKSGTRFWYSNIHPEDRSKVLYYYKSLRHESGEHILDYRAKTSSGKVIWLHDIVTVNHNTEGKPESMTGCTLDITERADAEAKLRLSASVFTNAKEGILITDANTTIIDVNDAFSQITGYSKKEVLGKKPSILKSAYHSEEFFQTMWDEINEKSYWSGEIWNKKKSGEIYAELLSISTVLDRANNIKNYVALFSDITEKKQQQKQLEDMAKFDILTNLPNRLLLADRLRQAMSYVERHDKSLTVVFLDLDGFKEVNDKYGHDIGDQLLITVSMRMKNVLRDEDTLARFGGDEFVAVLLDMQNVSECLPMLGRLLKAASKSVEIGEHLLKVSASLGVTFYPQKISIDADQLIRQADQAMYLAKQSGKNQYQIFDAKQDSNIRELHNKLERLQSAFANNEFVLYYQPNVNMTNGKIIGLEALIRWQHPDKGLLLPEEFLPIIDEHPLSIKINHWVIKTVMEQISQWHNKKLKLPVFVNINGYQLLYDNFANSLRDLLSNYSEVERNCLQLEVIESSTLQDISKIFRVIEECKSMGIHFVLDDFGRGYSSLNNLKQLPISGIKIDKSFVSDMLSDSDNLAILEGIVGMASAFRNRVVAKGVENIEQGELLIKIGCELAQGFKIAPPMPETELHSWMKNWQPNQRWMEQKPIRRGDIPILCAAIEHRSWVSRIEKHLSNKDEELPPLNKKECWFGKWLQSEASQSYSSEPIFKTIKRTHKSIHALANNILSLHSQGEDDLTRIELNELYALRDRLLQQLDSLLYNNREKSPVKKD